MTVDEESRIRSLVERCFEEKEALKKAEEAGTGDGGYEVGSDLSMTAKWNNGLELSTKNKDFRVHIGGRTQFDTSWYSAESNVNQPAYLPGQVIYQDGVDFRRARLRIDGTMYETMEWAVEYDFVNALRVSTPTASADADITALTDLWWTFKEVPVLGNIRVGNQKEPIGFEHLVSSRFLPFMERSYNQDAFYGGVFNGFTPGIQAFNTWDEEMGVWQIGLFKPVNNAIAFNAWDGDLAVTGRVTRLLKYCDEGNGLVHVGLASRWYTSVQDRQRFRTRDAMRAGLASVWPVVADTGNLYGDEGAMVDGELAAVYGPWTLQAEYLVDFFDGARRSLNDAPVDGLFYHGGYVQLLYFLTGEHENYNRKTGAFDRLSPTENAFLVRTPDGPICGKGAWQVGARYDYLDLNNQGINGGMLHNGTLGLNWFLNPNSKVQFNYYATYRDAEGVVIAQPTNPPTNLVLTGDQGTGWIHGWGIRFAHDF